MVKKPRVFALPNAHTLHCLTSNLITWFVLLTVKGLAAMAFITRTPLLLLFLLQLLSISSVRIIFFHRYDNWSAYFHLCNWS